MMEQTMTQQYRLKLSGVLGNPYLRVALVMIIVLIIGLVTVGDQGISTDERDDVLAPFWNYRLLTTGQPIENHVEFYGTVLPFTSEALFQVRSILTKGGFSTYYFDNNDARSHDHAAMLEFRERVETKHLVTFLLSLSAYIAVAGIVGILAGIEYAWLGPLVLALLPRFWGHSLFNPRDVPFAAMFTVGIFVGARLINYFLQTDREAIRPGWNRITGYSLLYGILIGVVTGTRLAGCFLLAFVAAAHLATALVNGVRLRDLLRYWWVYGLMFVSWAVFVTAIHPASWSNPVAWFYNAMSFLSRYQWDGANLFNGQFIPGYDAPWFYLPVWLMITTPIIFSLLFVGGASAILVRFRRLTPIQQGSAFLLLLQIGFFPVVAILRDSTIYDGLRQFLFILPAIAAIAATALAWIFQRLSSIGLKAAVLAVFILSVGPIVYDMFALHPYEYIYFNRAFGGLKAAHNRFETDYWCLSMREGIEWINENPGPGTSVVSTRELHCSESYALPTINVFSMREYDDGEVSRPFYYIARAKIHMQQLFPECPVVHQVMRQGVPLTIVKKCD